MVNFEDLYTGQNLVVLDSGRVLTHGFAPGTIVTVVKIDDNDETVSANGPYPGGTVGHQWIEFASLDLEEEEKPQMVNFDDAQVGDKYILHRVSALAVCIPNSTLAEGGEVTVLRLDSHDRTFFLSNEFWVTEKDLNFRPFRPLTFETVQLGRMYHVKRNGVEFDALVVTKDSYDLSVKVHPLEEVHCTASYSDPSVWVAVVDLKRIDPLAESLGR